MYTTFAPNLRLEIAVLNREREQGRFKGSTEEGKGSRNGEQRAWIWKEIFLRLREVLRGEVSQVVGKIGDDGMVDAMPIRPFSKNSPF